MSFYADTSFLVAAYSPEADSLKALQNLQHLTQPLPFTSFHRHELRTGIRLRVFRKQITPEQRKAAFAEIESDLADNILVYTVVSWTDVFREAEVLASNHVEKLGVRNFDLLHVAMATTLGATEFLTFDTRQSALARAAGLKVRF